ncbi:hypothetical protein [Methylorubrum extorquens]|uniref:hypothetical protein n=1 Tax=Methylorubrum extorquens TaxID=408 RepID=UPI0020A0EB76|nr:hypothetical protein [Methylorubrum extorquens]MCP1535662.1 heme exporter protein D [Methylorubrum extorquens]
MSTGTVVRYYWGTGRPTAFLLWLQAGASSLPLRLAVVEAEAAVQRADILRDHALKQRRIGHIRAGQVDGVYDRTRADAGIPWPTDCDDEGLNRLYGEAVAQRDRARLALKQAAASRSKPVASGEPETNPSVDDASTPPQADVPVAPVAEPDARLGSVGASPHGEPGPANDNLVVAPKACIVEGTAPEIAAEEADMSPPEPPLSTSLVIPPALAQEISLLLGDVDRPEAGPSEVGTVTDKVLDIFSAEVEAERARRRDPRRLPADYDPAWADHWPRDPNVPLPEMMAEFLAFGTAIDTPPGELSDEEARLLAGPAIFPKPLDYNSVTDKERPGRDFFTREQDMPPRAWELEIRLAGGTAQKLVAKNGLYINPFRAEERSRRRMWPLVVARRDLIKGLMEGLAVGEFSFEPVSMSEADLVRSVRWRVFREADHDWLGLVGRDDLQLYYTRILDKLPWPTGLSRRDLVVRFGQGQAPDEMPNLSTQGRPPVWLLPECDWVYGENFGPRSGAGATLAGIELDRCTMPFVPSPTLAAATRSEEAR